MLLAALMAMAMQAPAAAAAGGAAAPGPATAGAVEVFKALCIATDAEGAEAIRRADALKWTAPPPDAMASLPPMIQKMSNIQVRMVRQPDNSGFVLMTGNGADLLSTGKAAPNAACMVMGMNPTAADQAIKADTAALMGGTEPVNAGAMLIYAYTEKNGARTSMAKASDTELKAAFDGGRLRIVALDVEAGANLLLYIVPTQAN